MKRKAILSKYNKKIVWKFMNILENKNKKAFFTPLLFSSSKTNTLCTDLEHLFDIMQGFNNFT